MTLTGLEAQLPPRRFMKVHKSFIVAIEQVRSIENNDIIIGQSRIPISRSLKDEVMKRILGDNLLSR
jgi:DNA-binding LytR/AlgR family response regulator